jgi:hypothetical protein
MNFVLFNEHKYLQMKHTTRLKVQLLEFGLIMKETGGRSELVTKGKRCIAFGPFVNESRGRQEITKNQKKKR